MHFSGEMMKQALVRSRPRTTHRAFNKGYRWKSIPAKYFNPDLPPASLQTPAKETLRRPLPKHNDNMAVNLSFVQLIVLINPINYANGWMKK
jgi:hypothetical protein